MLSMGVAPDCRDPTVSFEPAGTAGCPGVRGAASPAPRRTSEDAAARSGRAVALTRPNPLWTTPA
jgi:hypothetical protein